VSAQDPTALISVPLQFNFNNTGDLEDGTSSPGPSGTRYSGVGDAADGEPPTGSAGQTFRFVIVLIYPEAPKR
jgi:hypothetical protein